MSLRENNHGTRTIEPGTPLRHYFSRSHSTCIRTNDLPVEQAAKGVYTPVGIFFICLKLTVPFAYIYILLILLRELSVSFPETVYRFMEHYIPILATIVSGMEQSSLIVEVWVVIEAIFYVCLKLQIQYLHYLDPLEASLRSYAPMPDMKEREVLWHRMLEAEREEDLVNMLSGWFYDEKSLETISKYDIMDFLTWSLFEGRNQEHLTSDEFRQLHCFVDDLEWALSRYLHGDPAVDKEWDSDRIDERLEGKSGSLNGAESSIPDDVLRRGMQLQKRFRFHESTHDETPSIFSNLYENYKTRYEQYRAMLENADFNPMQDFRNFMAETRQQIVVAEENAVARATHMAENAYNTFVPPGSNVDKQLAQIQHATHSQITEAWNSVIEMQERLKTAQFLSSQRKMIEQQLRGYRLGLDRMRSMSSAVPSKHMADLMRKITQCNIAMERIEKSAHSAFVKATGGFGKNLWSRKEPKRYYKYSYDPLLGISTYPLMFHLLILSVTEGGLRMLMKKRGFQRLRVGPVYYYYHPGLPSYADDDSQKEEEETPIVFCHGIGIGLIVYLPLVDELLKTGRPLLFPEIPFVSGFRPWQSPYSVLQPAVVSSTMTSMLATHGFLKGTFVGHSYGTSWLSYMCKYAPHSMASVLFLDPICFCLHVPRLTKKWVYHRADPGCVSYMVRTDIMINWTIQRSFPWAQIALFTEQIPVPCGIMVSECDDLVPAARVEKYLDSKEVPIMDFEEASLDDFANNPIFCTKFNGHGHGGWTENWDGVGKIVGAIETLCNASVGNKKR